jgi:hypothetical protein
MTDRNRAEQLLVALNPIPDTSIIVMDQRATDDLHRILDSPAAAPAPAAETAWSSRRARTFRLGVLAATAALAVGGLQIAGVLPGSGDKASAYVVWPLAVEHPPEISGAAAQLRAIADRVATIPDDKGTGDVATLKHEAWYIVISGDEGAVSSSLEAHTVTSTIQKNGDGTSVTATTDEDGKTDTETTTLRNTLTWGFRGLSEDPDQIARQLSPGHEQQGRVARLDALVEAYLEMPIDPGARAAMLRYLAETESIASVGTVTDRAGRDGIGFTVDSASSGIPTRYMVIIDPNTGELLDYEELFLSGVSHLKIKAPAAASYIVFRESGYSN